MTESYSLNAERASLSYYKIINLKTLITAVHKDSASE